jgi:hypothetical protein
MRPLTAERLVHTARCHRHPRRTQLRRRRRRHRRRCRRFHSFRPFHRPLGSAAFFWLLLLGIRSTNSVHIARFRCGRRFGGGRACGARRVGGRPAAPATCRLARHSRPVGRRQPRITDGPAAATTCSIACRPKGAACAFRRARRRHTVRRLGISATPPRARDRASHALGACCWPDSLARGQPRSTVDPRQRFAGRRLGAANANANARDTARRRCATGLVRR